MRKPRAKKTKPPLTLFEQMVKDGELKLYGKPVLATTHGS